MTPPISSSPMLVNGLDVMAIMTHAIVNGKETRRLREVVEVVQIDEKGNAVTNTPFKWNPADDKFYYAKESRVFEKIGGRYGLSKEMMQKEFETRTRLLYTLFQNKVLAYDDVQRVVNDYAKMPDVILKKYGLA